MKKFEENDILINKVRAYPKVSFFVYDGKVYYNKTNKDGVVLNNFLSTDLEKLKQSQSPVQPSTQENITTENSEPVLAENDDYLIME